MKTLKPFCLALLLSLTTHSALAANECFTHELNPATNKVFSSETEYNSALQEWQKLAPEKPGILSLAKAYAIYKSENKKALSLGNDKRAHCYMGCRISQDTSYRVAEYVGWLKEDRDIRDCNINSHFDPADNDATVVGAHLGESQTDAEGCESLCRLSY